MEFMQSQSDKSFDLAIVDPPTVLIEVGKEKHFLRMQSTKENSLKIEDGTIKFPEKIILIIYFVYQKIK